MSKKKKKNKRQLTVPAPPRMPRFAIGDRVRVRAGISCPDHLDIPWGGWAGVIDDVDASDGDPAYSVTWSQETLATAHPVYFRRCERDNVESDSAWLVEADLELDPGTPLAIEQPTRLVPPPLDLRSPADLARKVLGVASDEELPPITADRVIRFHVFLTDNVKSPVPVVVDEEGNRKIEDCQPAMVSRVLPLTPEMSAWDFLVEVRHLDGEVERKAITEIMALPGSTGGLALQAYHEWLDTVGNPDIGKDPPASSWVGWKVQMFALAGLMGAVLLGLLEAMPSTHLLAQIGACLLGLLGGFMGGTGELSLRRLNGLRSNVAGGGLLGMLIGAFLGGTLGAVLAVGLGALAGAAAGLLLGGVLVGMGIRWPGPLRLTVLGIGVGSLTLAYYSEPSLALSGMWRGLLGGLALAAIVSVGAWVYFAKVAPGRITKA